MKSKLFNRGFVSLIVTQFFGAANDNILLDVRCGDAIMGDETALTIPELEGGLCALVFHDAGWANADEPDDKVTGTAWWCMRRAKTAYAPEAPKRLKAKSQGGFVVFVTEKKILENGEGKAALVDWISQPLEEFAKVRLPPKR